MFIPTLFDVSPFFESEAHDPKSIKSSMAIADLLGSVDIGKTKKMKYVQTWVQGKG